jgi:hypothetical protein
LNAIEAAIDKEAVASPVTRHAVFAECLYRNFLRAMQNTQDAVKGFAKN